VFVIFVSLVKTLEHSEVQSGWLLELVHSESLGLRLVCSLFSRNFTVLRIEIMAENNYALPLSPYLSRKLLFNSFKKLLRYVVS